MKAKTIIKIEEVLKQRKEIEYASYKNIKSNLKQKYGIDWNINDITSAEKPCYISKKKHGMKHMIYMRNL